MPDPYGAPGGGPGYPAQPGGGFPAVPGGGASGYPPAPGGQVLVLYLCHISLYLSTFVGVGSCC